MAWFPSPTLMIPLNSGLECPTGISSVALPKWSYSPPLAHLSRWRLSCTISYPSNHKSAGSALEIHPKFKNVSGTSLYPSSPICDSFWSCYRTARVVCVPGKFNLILPLNSVSFPGLPWWRSMSLVSSSPTGKTKPILKSPLPPQAPYPAATHRWWPSTSPQACFNEGQLLVWATLLKASLLSCPCQRGLPLLPLPGQGYMSILGAFFFFQIFCKVEHFKIQNWSGRMEFKLTRLRTRDLKAEPSSSPNLAWQSQEWIFNLARHFHSHQNQVLKVPQGNNRLRYRSLSSILQYAAWGLCAHFIFKKPSYTVRGNVNWYNHYGEQYRGALKNFRAYIQRKTYFEKMNVPQSPLQHYL